MELVLGRVNEEEEEEEEVEGWGTLTLELGKSGLERSRGTEGAEGARGLEGPARRPLLRPFDSELPLLLLGWNQLLLSMLLVEGAGAGAEGRVKDGWVVALEGGPVEEVEDGPFHRLSSGLVVVVVEGLPSVPPEGKPPKPLGVEEEEGGWAVLKGGKPRPPPRPTLEGAGPVVAGLDP